MLAKWRHEWSKKAFEVVETNKRDWKGTEKD